MTPLPQNLPRAKRHATRPEMTLEVKPQLMSAMYKLYGSPKFTEMFVARSLFLNDTAETLSDYRARFRIDGNSSWTPWAKMDQVFSGQTVVNGFYPVIDSKITNLKGTAPAQVELEFEYSRPNGDRVTDSESGRTELLGVNEALWSNVEFDSDSTWYDMFRMAPIVLSNFTSATDPVMLDVVGMISKSTGGQGHSISDESALKFMGTLFNLFRQNISYETTPGAWRNGLMHQHVKYGRDVLRTKSGTCVNLAIAYASACEAAGLRPYIMLGGGNSGNHAFPAVKLPQSGEMVYVETTLCGGGTNETSSSFVQAREVASKIHQQWWADGRMIEVDIRALREMGVAAPELPELGQNPLKDWAIQAPDAVVDVLLPRMLVKIKDLLIAGKQPYQLHTGRTALEFEFQSQAGNKWTVVVQTFEDEEIMAVMSMMPGIVPEDQRKRVSAFLAEHNTSFQHGNFELTQSGRVSFRTSSNVRGGQLTPEMLMNEFEYHVKNMDFNIAKLRPLVSTTGEGGAMAISEQLVGTWKTSVQIPNTTIIATVISILSADGTFDATTTLSNGNVVREKGHWSYTENKFTMTAENGQPELLKMKIVNRNRLIVHDRGLNIDLIYNRVTENN